jgi:integrase
MARHLLSDLRVQKAKPRAKAYRLADGDGLYLYVPTTTKDARAWQYRYRHDGKPQTLTLGKLSRLTLAQARNAAGRARAAAAEGRHLTVEKRVTKAKRRANAQNTFATVAADWIKTEARRARWSLAYRGEVEASFRNHLSEFDALPLVEITAQVAAPVLRKVEHAAPMMTEKVRRRLRAVLDYGVEQGVIVGNPLPATRRGPRMDRRHFPAVTDLPGLGEILRAASASDPCKGIQRAHMLLAFTAMRVSEVVGASWREFSLDGVDVAVADGNRTKYDPEAGNWTIPRARMKRKDEKRGPHVVPLPGALLEALREWHESDGAGAVYVCRAPRDPAKPVTAEAVEKHYRNALALGGKHSPHSWRSAFSTVARDAGKDADAIEAQLDHVVGNKTAASYDRAKRLELRRALMTWYEDALIAARDRAKVLGFTGRRGRGGPR